MSVNHPEWQGLIDPDETILWQGAPDGGFKIKFDSPMSPIVSVLVLAFSIYWMQGAAQGGGNFWLFGLIFAFAGLYEVIGVHFYDTWKRRNTFYTLTDKRAFIATRGFKGKSLDSYLISPDTRIRLEGDTSIYFAQETKQSGDSTKIIDIGFRFIEDTDVVLGHLRQIQQEAQT